MPLAGDEPDRLVSGEHGQDVEHHEAGRSGEPGARWIDREADAEDTEDHAWDGEQARPTVPGGSPDRPGESHRGDGHEPGEHVVRGHRSGVALPSPSPGRHAAAPIVQRHCSPARLSRAALHELRTRSTCATMIARNSSGPKRKWVVPSCHSALNVTRTRPSRAAPLVGVSASRSCAIGEGSR